MHPPNNKFINHERRAEGQFGLEQIRPYLTKLKAGSNVLEVGCGSGVLPAMVKTEFPHLVITGIEPIIDGFSHWREYFGKDTDVSVNLQNIGYESLSRTPNYDLIYSVNVLEHMADWRDFLRFAVASLNSNGKCVILAPNYSFPYESHFRIPIIFNKRLSAVIFKRLIANFEVENTSQGLWDGLNFVTFREVQRELSNLPIQTRLTTDVSVAMFDRAYNEPAFKERHKRYFWIIQLFKKLRIPQLLSRPRFSFLAPYMIIELNKAP